MPHEGRVIEGPQPPHDPVAVATIVRPHRTGGDEARGGVNLAAGDEMLDRQLGASFGGVPGCRPTMELRRRSGLTLLELPAQVVTHVDDVRLRGGLFTWGRSPAHKRKESDDG